MQLVTLFFCVSSLKACLAQDAPSSSSRSSLTLDPSNVNIASQQTGQNGTNTPGWIDSKTDDANFINYCTGKTLTNGQQNKAGSCNGIVMGDIPSTQNMISTIILSPAPGQTVPAHQDLTVSLRITNLAAGQFTAPLKTYFAAPQALDRAGLVRGHVHVTVQDLGASLTPARPPDAASFVAFKGVNDAGDGRGVLQTTFKGGLPPGFYRACTIAAAANHQPALMPVAQRGAQDDCTRFAVV